MNTTLIACLMLGTAAFAQEAPVYRLHFALHEMEGGKRISTHNYTMLASPQSNTRLNAGTKVPIPTAGNNSQFTYVDVGVNLRAKVQERGSQLLLSAEVEVSNLGADRENPSRPAPRIQQIRSDIDAAIPLGQATPIVSLDDPGSTRHFEIEVTATKVK
jgi:hypothetical protein